MSDKAAPRTAGRCLLVRIRKLIKLLSDFMECCDAYDEKILVL